MTHSHYLFNNELGENMKYIVMAFQQHHTTRLPITIKALYPMSTESINGSDLTWRDGSLSKVLPVQT